ncbi:MAG: pyruvate, phosphate dikinase [Firmicutes bacterium]|jgi:pyruvate,orthophosphate dikinase|nr:pyruvate, phosphate dikinase [Bacillota bacterium]
MSGQSGQWVYRFAEGRAEMKNLLGGKGANLAEMSRVGLPVPPGFTITTAACNAYYERGRQIWPELAQQIEENLAYLEKETGRSFGGDKPLLVSVRSGAMISMPGMMDTILNLGLTPKTVEALAAESSDRRFAMDCFRRFIQMFADVVLKVESYHFENILTEKRNARNVRTDAELQAEDLAEVVEEFLKVVRRETGTEFPFDPREQLFLAVKAVFDSWHNPRATVYRQINRIPDDLGTAVNVQAMVFGNLNNQSGTGVAFTRSPATGEPVIYGEYLLNAQGEDVVAGIRTPRPIAEMAQELPEIYKQFVDVCRKLEAHYRDMQDIEFTIENGKLYILQTRNAKRTAAAAVKVAVDLVREGVISKDEALLRVEPDQLDQLLHRRIDPEAKLNVLAYGLPASPGAATGKVVFDPDRAQELASENVAVLLVRSETTPDDIHGIKAAQGVLTSRGGMTSHAAVVARGMGKPCVCGCEALKIDAAKGKFYIDGQEYAEGEVLSIDGATGRVILGEVPLIDPELTPEFKELLSWADAKRRLRVRANADTPDDAALAVELGAEGIGLCRTEHMFMDKARVPVVQKMILAATLKEREAAMAELLPMQKDDFKGILQAMTGLPVTIRLLDPPLHEFLPNREALLLEVDRLRREGGDGQLLLQREELLLKVRALAEQNPMLGHRGCRLGLVYPEIYSMQVTAIFQAAVELVNEGIAAEQIKLEIMIPLVGHGAELARMKKVVDDAAAAVLKEAGLELPYLVGTMIELPRACMVADELAQEAEFFSFGTNDLTQTTLGYSRDDAEGKFLPFYLEHKILPANPFMEVDRDGVGALVRIAMEKGRKTRPDIKLGICGEHGGDPASIEFFHSAGLHYVSCSPYRIPIARLAAARAVLKG